MFWWEDPLWQGPAQQEERFTRQDIIGEIERNKMKGKKSDINHDLKPRKSYNDQWLCISAEHDNEKVVDLRF